MGRNKVKPELIANEYARRVTYRKRKTNLLKKLKELTILCGVTACAVIFNTFGSQMEVWPSRTEANSLLKKFRKLPEKKQDKFKMDSEAFLSNSIDKAEERLKKQRKKNLELILVGYVEGNILSIDMFREVENKDDAIELVEDCIRFVDSKIENGGDDNESNDSDEIISDNDG